MVELSEGNNQKKELEEANQQRTNATNFAANFSFIIENAAHTNPVPHSGSTLARHRLSHSTIAVLVCGSVERECCCDRVRPGDGEAKSTNIMFLTDDFPTGINVCGSIEIRNAGTDWLVRCLRYPCFVFPKW